MSNRGSSFGKPSTGDANLFRILSPTTPFHNLSSITTEIELIFPEDVIVESSFLEQEKNNDKTNRNKKGVLFIIKLEYK